MTPLRCVLNDRQLSIIIGGSGVEKAPLSPPPNHPSRTQRTAIQIEEKNLLNSPGQ